MEMLLTELKHDMFFNSREKIEGLYQEVVWAEEKKQEILRFMSEVFAY